MTTIATDGKVMAADMQMTDGKMIVRYDGKLRKIKGHLVGGAGSVENLEIFFQWYEAMLDGNPPKGVVRVDKNFEGIAVNPEGEIWLYGPRLVAMKTEEKTYAIGSGSYVAFGALDMGASPVDAVKAAIKRDIYTGIGVIVIERDEPGGDVSKEHRVRSGKGVRKKPGRKPKDRIHERSKGPRRRNKIRDQQEGSS